jgi:urease accessory protein
MSRALLDGAAQFFLPSHLLAVVALGLLVGQGARALLLALFALGLAAGAVAIASAVRETPAATVLLGIAALAGVIVVLAWTPPWPLAGALALTAGSAIALNAPPHALTIPAAIATQVGTAMAALVTLALIASIGASAERPWQRIGVRIVGSWIAASAILALVLRLAR